MHDAVIVSAVRTAVGKAPKGTLSVMRPDDMASVAIREALDRAPGASADDVDDVILGCAMPEGEQGLNVARIASLRRRPRHRRPEGRPVGVAGARPDADDLRRNARP